MGKPVWTLSFGISIGVLGLGVIAEGMAYFAPGEALNRIAYWSLSLANLLAINYLYRHGSFSRSRYRNVIYLLISLLITGMLFKIQHWSGASIMLSGLCLAIVALYAAWTISKPARGLLDYLKLLWVALYSLFTFLKVMRFYDAGILETIIITGLLYFIYIRFHVERKLRPVVEESEWDFDKSLRMDQADSPKEKGSN